MPVDHSFHPLFERLAAEVYEQPYGLIEQAQVGQELLAMNRKQMLHRLDLYDQTVVHQQVDLECGREADAFIFDIDRVLSLDLVAPPPKRLCQYELIDAFQEAGSELPM